MRNNRNEFHSDFKILTGFTRLSNKRILLLHTISAEYEMDLCEGEVAVKNISSFISTILRWFE